MDCVELYIFRIYAQIIFNNIMNYICTIRTSAFRDIHETKVFPSLNNHLILLSKQYIYNCKLKDVLPSRAVFLTKVKAVFEMEHRIAKERNKLSIIIRHGTSSFPKNITSNFHFNLNRPVFSTNILLYIYLSL